MSFRLWCLLLVMASLAATGAESLALPLLDLTAAGLARLQPTSPQVTTQAGEGGVEVRIAPGGDLWPGVKLRPEGGKPWDLSATGHVEAKIRNIGETPLNLSLRIDNAAGDRNPWNSESVRLQPGEAGNLAVIFGYSYGRRPSFRLNPAAVTQLQLFVGKTEQALAFRVEGLAAAGPAGEKPPVAPQDVRIDPAADGNLLDAKMWFRAKGGAQGRYEDDAAQLVFPAGTGAQSVSCAPPVGRWSLRRYMQVRVKLTNNGTAPIAPTTRLDSDFGATDTIALPAPLAPGSSAEVVVPFAALKPWFGAAEGTVVKAPPRAGTGAPEGHAVHWAARPGTGNSFASNVTSGVTVTVMGTTAEQRLRVTALVAELPPPSVPDWLGQRPPVPGDWTKTFDDSFDGNAVDESKWNIAGPNYWDKTTHWSKNNLIVSGGLLRIRYEKKTGYHNDDPATPHSPANGYKSDYACGFLESYGKWTQRYGYFETRVKLPTAPGLWPAFWMMPDRGPATEKRGLRSDTFNGGMEFDVMEHLTRWGANRYNIAMHWDGYGDKHQAIGAKPYVQPDAEGFITCGLLWTPGLAVYYGNGREIARWEHPRIASVPANMMFTMPCGGWDNDYLDDAQLPADLIVDHVRVWQRADLASPPAPAALPQP